MKLIEKIEDLRSNKYYLEYDKCDYGKTIAIMKCCDIRNKIFQSMWAEGKLITASTSARDYDGSGPGVYKLYHSNNESVTGEYNIDPKNYPIFELTDAEVLSILALTI